MSPKGDKKLNYLYKLNNSLSIKDRFLKPYGVCSKCNKKLPFSVALCPICHGKVILHNYKENERV